MAHPRDDIGPNPFAGSPLDRLAEWRSHEEWFRLTLAHPNTVVVPVWDSQVLVRDGERCRACLLPGGEAARLLEQSGVVILLGKRHKRTYVAVDLVSRHAAAEAQRLGAARFVDLKPVGALLPGDEAAVLAYARAMAYWHRQTRYCGACGSETVACESGHVRKCASAACARQHFPRTDPAIIVLVTHGDRCLLARQREWAPGQFATIAGFVEPGESLEDAVAREIREEVGVAVSSVRYHSSQPWPFPASIMIGYTAEADATEVRLRGGELEAARWFDRAELARAVSDGDIRLPSLVSISYRLVEHWFDAAGDTRLRDLAGTSG